MKTMTDYNRLLETFLEYVQIDSVSGSEEAVCARLTEDLSAIGLVAVETGGELLPGAKTLMVELKGESGAKPLILGAHVDTVTPGCGIVPALCPDGYIRSKGNTILASDDKSGVVAILEALRTITERQLPHRTVQVFFTVGEETGLLGSKAVDPSMLIAQEAVILDTSKDVGRIVTSAPGQLKLNATVHGKAAHAGNAPEHGISAIRVAARAIDRMKLQRIDSETTANIGTFDAVGSTNIISPEAKLVFEIRSRNTEKLYGQAEDMINCLKDACREFGGTVEYELKESYLGYRIPDDDPLVRRIFDACEKIGAKPFTAATGGGSDANIFNQYGITAVNIATGMENVHTTDEQISLENLKKIAELALELMLV